MTGKNPELYLEQMDELINQAEIALTRYEELQNLLELVERERGVLEGLSVKELQSDLEAVANEISAIADDALPLTEKRVAAEFAAVKTPHAIRSGVAVAIQRRTYI